MLHYASQLRSFAVFFALGAVACSSDDSSGAPTATGTSTSATGGQAGTATTTAGGTTTTGAAGSGGSGTTTGGGGTSASAGGSGGASGASTGSGGSGGSGAPDASTSTDGAGGGSAEGGKPDGGSADAGDPDAAMLPFKLTSSAFMEGGNYPAANTCPTDMSPDLTWGPGPAATTKGYAMVLWDRTNMFRHWAIWDIPPTTTSLPAGLAKTATLTTPMGAKQISFRGNGYAGPCPPGGATDTYEFALYAVDIFPLPGNKGSAMAAETAIIAHQVAKTTLSGKGQAH